MQQYLGGVVADDIIIIAERCLINIPNGGVYVDKSEKIKTKIQKFIILMGNCKKTWTKSQQKKK